MVMIYTTDGGWTPEGGEVEDFSRIATRDVSSHTLSKPRPTDCVWLVPTWVPPTPEPEE